jgi:hypothetical protein
MWIKPQRNEEGIIPYGVHIAGIDVVDKDLANTDSLPCIIMMNKYTRQIVAEYTGRTDDAKDFYEICRKMLMYYNAIGMYEQNLTGLFTYFTQKKCTYLLADTPHQLRNAETYREGTNTSKGIHNNKIVNSEGRSLIKSWLQETISEKSETRVLETIYSSAILLELIMWNSDGNFDRVSALIMLMWFDATLFKEETKVREGVKALSDHPYWESMGLTKKQDYNVDYSKFYS